MAAPLGPSFREGLARMLLGACLLLFAIFVGISDILAQGPVQGISLVLGLVFAILGLALAADGFSRMSGRHP